MVIDTLCVYLLPSSVIAEALLLNVKPRPLLTET